MIVIKLQEGFGNQLFQYGFAKYLESHINESVYFDTSFYLAGNSANMFGREFELENNCRNFLNIKQIDVGTTKIDYIIREDEFVSTEEFTNWYGENRERVILFVGYWQDIPKYLNPNREVLQKLFAPNVKTLERIYGEDTIRLVQKGITLHVRHGKDYQNLSNVHPPQEISYYKSALEKIGGSNNLEVFILTDDINYCKNNEFLRNFSILSEPDALQIRGVNHNFQFSPIYEFQLMQISRYNICSNSTFSLMAAYLNEGCEKIIIPKNWFGADSTYKNFNFLFDRTEII